MILRHHGKMKAFFPDDGIYQYAPCGAYLPDGSRNRSNVWMHVNCEECLVLKGVATYHQIYAPPIGNAAELDVWLDA